MPKILYLEDEHYLGRIVSESLKSRGFDIHLIDDGNKVITAYTSLQPDLCILDVMVPNIDGFTLAKEIKKHDEKMPIIFLTAKTQTEDVLEGFKSGGNDYLKKPFSMEELIVRIENLLNYTSNQNSKTPTINQLGNYTYNYDKFELGIDDIIYTLSHRENELVQLLSENINQKIDRREILRKIWGDDSSFNSRNLDVYIRKIRVYFEKDPQIKLTTLRGIGYHFSIG